MADGALPPIAWVLITHMGWFILPNWATNVTVLSYHRFRGLLKPSYQPHPSGSPQAIRIWRYSYAFVIITYLATTTAYGFITMPENFYEILDISPNADELAIKAAFKKFARKNHPDRAGPQSEALFIEIRKVYEALSNPTKRFAYDRFGSQAIDWIECVTSREYIQRGLTASSGFYIGMIGFLLVWSIFSSGNLGTYWRNLLLCTLFFTELYLIINGSTETLSIFQYLPIFRNRVPYQYILFLHQLYVSLSIAISRVLPVLLPSSFHISASTMQVLKPMVDKLALLAATADKEVSRMLAAEIQAMHGSSALPSSVGKPIESSGANQHVTTPFVPSDKTITALTAEMENLLIDRQLQLHPVLRGYWEAAIQRRWQHREQNSVSSMLPSPPKSLSPSESLSLKTKWESTKNTLEHLPNVKELPSPRPSPPRQLDVQDGSNSSGNARGRSLSC